MSTENRFGMFIHWGMYAQTKLHEQAYARYDIAREDYEPLARTFNPVDYDPEKWVKMAKDAGMTYICFTTKHHDGFCMWDTKYTDYNIMNTPYGRDVLKMLSEACARYDMKLSLYYSIPDWHHPLSYNPASTHQWKVVDPSTVDTEGYRAFVRNQVTELLTNYGPIYTFFWDIPPHIEDPSMNELLRRLQPGILINDRGYDKGDFSTPEREYQAIAGARFSRMTEACNSLGQQSWGFREQEDFYSLRHLKSAIDQIMGMGGSYLLNAGPDDHGVITPAYADRLKNIGEWYQRVRVALENNTASSVVLTDKFNPLVLSERDGKTYMHYYRGLISSAATVQGAPALPRQVRLVNTDQKLNFAIEVVPEFFSGKTGRAEDLYLHITGIPVDELDEPVILEVTW